MDIKIRLFRRPLTTALWILVLTAMAMLLGVGANLLHSADSLLGIIDQHHTTIAVQTMEAGLTAMGNYQNISVTLNNMEIRKLRELDSVEKVDLRTLTGAYIPELTGQIALMNWGTVCQADMDLSWAESKFNDSYNEVILTGTVIDTEIRAFGSDPETNAPYDCTRIGGDDGLYYDTQCFAVVEIDEVVSAHPDYVFEPSEAFTGYTGRINVQFNFYADSCEKETVENPLKIGEKYIFSGFYEPMCSRKGLGDISWPREGSDEMHPWLNVGGRFHVPGAPIDCSELIQQGDDLVIYEDALVDYIVWYDRGKPIPIYPRNETPSASVSRLDGTVEELLAENELWAEAVRRYSNQLHSFPVIGTEAVETMYVFNRNDAVMVQGRYFDQSEYDSGAKVCIISETTAQNAGIRVGDTIHLSQFICGKKAEEGNTSLHTFGSGGSLNNPAVGRFPPREYVTENEEFTVIGIYQLQRTWDSSSFSITPNTIFIPQKAQIPGGFGGASYSSFSGADYNDGYGTYFPNGAYGVYFSAKIKNGMADEFLAQAGEIVPNRFHIYDQGYEAAQESVRAVGRDAWKLMGLASIGWLLLLALYVLLYQDKERSNLGILRSVGGTPVQGRRYLFSSGLLIACAGILAGTVLSSGATRLVSSHLAEFMVSEGTMQAMSGGMELGAGTMADILSRASLPGTTLLLLTAAQLAVIALTLWLHAHIISRRSPRELLSKS